jgi:hypothetical protein
MCLCLCLCVCVCACEGVCLCVCVCVVCDIDRPMLVFLATTTTTTTIGAIFNTLDEAHAVLTPVHLWPQLQSVRVCVCVFHSSASVNGQQKRERH